MCRGHLRENDAMVFLLVRDILVTIQNCSLGAYSDYTDEVFSIVVDITNLY